MFSSESPRPRCTNACLFKKVCNYIISTACVCVILQQRGCSQPHTRTHTLTHAFNQRDTHTHTHTHIHTYTHTHTHTHTHFKHKVPVGWFLLCIKILLKVNFPLHVSSNAGNESRTSISSSILCRDSFVM